MVIERPESMEAKHWTQTALAANPSQPPSVAMNSDVRDIAARERAAQVRKFELINLLA
jgi:hypothetical protein